MESLSDFPTHLLEKVLYHSSFSSGKSLLCTCTSINNRKNEIKWLPIIQNVKHTFVTKTLQGFNDFHRTNFTKEFDAYLYGVLRYFRYRYQDDTNVVNMINTDKYSSCHLINGKVAIKYHSKFRNYELNKKYVFGPYTQITKYSNYLLGVRTNGKMVILFEDRDPRYDAILSKQFLDIKASLLHVDNGKLGLTCLSLDGKVYIYDVHNYTTYTETITLDRRITSLEGYKCIDFAIVDIMRSYFLFGGGGIGDGIVAYKQGSKLKQISLSEKYVYIARLANKTLRIYLKSGKKIIFTEEDHEKDRISYLKNIPCNW